MNGLAYYAGYRDTVNVTCNPNRKRSDPSMAIRPIPEYPISVTPPKIIKTTQGDEVLVDAEDYPLLARHIWYTHGEGKTTPYAFTVMKTERAQVWRCIFMHHLVLGTSCTIDHKDTNSLNNQKHNLRSATYRENGWNRPANKNSRTGFKGVSEYTSKDGKKLYRVVIRLTAKGVVPIKNLKRDGFKTAKDAAIFYNEEVVKIRGKFAYLNTIPSTIN